MSRLAISALGMPRIEYAGAPLAVDRRKAVALLTFLAVEGRAHGRDALATLLWPGYDQSTARGNLRRTLSTLHTALGEEWLAIDRDTVALKTADGLSVDVREFERLLAECGAHGHSADQVCPRCAEPLRQAIARYRDDFLTGFTLPDAPEFDDWQRQQTERLRQLLSGALARLARGLVEQGDTYAALAHVRRRVALDPLDEDAQRQLMQPWRGPGIVARRCANTRRASNCYAAKCKPRPRPRRPRCPRRSAKISSPRRATPHLSRSMLPPFSPIPKSRLCTTTHPRHCRRRGPRRPAATSGRSPSCAPG